MLFKKKTIVKANTNTEMTEMKTKQQNSTSKQNTLFPCSYSE